MRTVLLFYRIPSKVNIPNPASFLRRFGFSTDGSVWFIPEQNLPMVPVKLWREKGATVEVVRFDEGESETVMRLAREALSKNVAETLASLEGAVDKLKDRYANVATGDYVEAKVVHGQAVRYVRQARKALEAAQECAATFMLLGDFKLLFDGVRQSIRANDALFYSMYNQKRSGVVPLPAPVGDPVELKASEVLEGAK
jgi:hypothetical protein